MINYIIYFNLASVFYVKIQQSLQDLKAINDLFTLRKRVQRFSVLL